MTECTMIKTIATVTILAGTALFAAGTEAAKAQQAAEQRGEIHYGKILEKKEVMGYDYLYVSEDGRKRWVAIANAPVEAGETIGYDTRTVMKHFKSKSLGRVFDEIVFANEVYLPTTHKAPSSMKAMLTKDIEVAKETMQVKDFKEKPFYTVEELHRWRRQLAGKEVRIRAKVYKVSRQIMKRDWVHLGDGTGDEKKLTDDIVFTAKKADVKAGDEVVAKAKIVVDKDFGYGYFYRVMGENATFKKQ